MDKFEKRDGFRFKLQESMAQVDLVHQYGSKFIPAVRLTAKDDLFKSYPSLTSSPSDIKSVIPRSTFQVFVSGAVAAVREGWFSRVRSECLHRSSSCGSQRLRCAAQPSDCSAAGVTFKKNRFLRPNVITTVITAVIIRNSSTRPSRCQHLHHYHPFSSAPPLSLQ
jgi:hypothetical protein